MTTKVICPNCRKFYVPDLAKRPDFTSKRTVWRGGKLIQDVWPDATSDQREQLVTGVCNSKCWDEFVGGGNEA